MALQNLHPRFKSGRRLQIFSSNSIVCAATAQTHALQLDYGGSQISSPPRWSRRKSLIQNGLISGDLERGEVYRTSAPELQPRRQELAHKAESVYGGSAGTLTISASRVVLSRATSRTSSVPIRVTSNCPFLPYDFLLQRKDSEKTPSTITKASSRVPVQRTRKARRSCKAALQRNRCSHPSR